MAKKKKSSYMYPRLHQQVQEAVSDEIPSLWFNTNNKDKSSINEHHTNVMGNFRCFNNTCATTGWSSKKVAVVIKGYEDDGYNAEVYNQRCRGCKALGWLKVDEQSYIDRVSYRVMKWAGVSVEPPAYDGKKGRPHREDLCEGCKRGVCRRTEDRD